MRKYGKEEIIRNAMQYPIDKVIFRYRQDTGPNPPMLRR